MKYFVNSCVCHQHVQRGLEFKIMFGGEYYFVALVPYLDLEPVHGFRLTHDNPGRKPYDVPLLVENYQEVIKFLRFSWLENILLGAQGLVKVTVRCCHLRVNPSTDCIT